MLIYGGDERMKTYTVKQVSDLLKIPKDTLIYYDKLGVVQPQRGDNGYRYYTSQDIRELKYVEVAKSNDYTLKEIRLYLEYQRQPTLEGFQWQRKDMKKKRRHLCNRLKDIQAMIDYLDMVEDLMEKKVQSGYSDTDSIHAFLSDAFDRLRRNENGEE
jgi:DNA-binding transcriptional MerR regulator